MFTIKKVWGLLVIITSQLLGISFKHLIHLKFIKLA